MCRRSLRRGLGRSKPPTLQHTTHSSRHSPVLAPSLYACTRFSALPCDISHIPSPIPIPIHLYILGRTVPLELSTAPPRLYVYVYITYSYCCTPPSPPSSLTPMPTCTHSCLYTHALILSSSHPLIRSYSALTFYHSSFIICIICNSCLVSS